ncbi:beta-ketoacyl-ACP synthase [Cupriavidus pauculus]|uniref:beta-ketoacyl-ACP synthase n=1 Tax=Cupriavidus pauculus TaxID=82633 RepID=UPI000782CDC7|nr:beta-ketoacyl-ACP synthase [Cupriavidus pauculus]MBY4734323.1 beta-ketoacyl-ACP synthase [Cupriavidus pauculus]
MKRVVVTGAGAVSALGNDWAAVRARLASGHNAVVRMDDWAAIDGLNTQLAAPVPSFEVPPHYTRKLMRTMGRVAQMAVVASESALADAGLAGHPIVTDGRMGIAYGSSTGTPSAAQDFARMMSDRTTDGINATTYIRMMAHTTAVNIGLFLGVTGRILTTSSACTSGSHGIGYAYETIAMGRQVAMLAGGAEELDATEAAVFDTLFAASTRNDAPQATPRPFDAARDGLVLGEGAGTLVLEALDHAQARGARILAEVVGYGTNSDGNHVTQAQPETMAQAMRMALEDAGLQAQQIGYINAHGTATEQGDLAEAQATHMVFGDGTPISSLKSYLGHTLGACGALEAWMTIEMMRDGWFAPTINLDTPDPRCAPLDHIVGAARGLDVEYAMSNNFAFGGINTSLIFRRWTDPS